MRRQQGSQPIHYAQRIGSDRGRRGPVSPRSSFSADAIRKAEVAARAARAPVPLVATIELRNSDLSDALSALRSDPTAFAYLHVAEEYRRAGVLDQALDYFDEALKRAPRLAAAYDGRARIWRDWHIPGLGSVIQLALCTTRPGRPRPTTRRVRCSSPSVIAPLPGSAFQKAIDLDPAATYAKTNLQAVNQMRQDGQRCQPAQVTPRRSAK